MKPIDRLKRASEKAGAIAANAEIAASRHPAARFELNLIAEQLRHLADDLFLVKDGISRLELGPEPAPFGRHRP
jgi:hypothetical protein